MQTSTSTGVRTSAGSDEVATLTGFLDYQRATLAWKCAGLDSAGLAVTVAASSMTLGGMLKHLALVEDDWFCRDFLGQEYPPPWNTVDWDADRDWDWHSAAADMPSSSQLWQAAVGRSRAVVSDTLASGASISWLSAPGRTAGPRACADSVSHDRGIRPAQRPCRSHPRVD